MPTCPFCQAEIPADNVNIRDAIAHCAACNAVVQLAAVAENADDRESDAAATREPPRGCRIDDLGAELRIGAPARSQILVFITLFAILWNAFVVAAISAVTLGVTSSSNGLGVVAIAMIPFVLVGLALIGGVVALWQTRITVVLRGGDGEVLIGPPIKQWRRTFQVSEVVAIRIRDSDVTVNHRTVPCIHLVKAKGKPLKFGTLLTRPSLLWLAGTLRAVLAGGR